MSKRNIAWLVAIVVVGAIVWVAAGWLWGLIAAVAVLVVSELVERQARAKRQAERGVTPGSPLRDVVKSRRPRR
jgi:hypothetical protein